MHKSISRIGALSAAFALIATGVSLPLAAQAREADDSFSLAAPIDAGTQAQRERQCYSYLVGKGLRPIHAAAFVGNWVVESGVSASQHEIGGAGYGLAQWTSDRRGYLEDFARSQKKPVSDLAMQLDFVWHELKGKEAPAYRAVVKAETVQAATKAVMKSYERPDPKRDHFDRRVKAAERVLREQSGGPVEAPPHDTDSLLPTLVLGAKGASVTVLQHLLMANGAGIKADGDFGDNTLQAVKAYQKSHGLDSDGKVGKMTWEKLLPTLKQGPTNSHATMALQVALTAAGNPVPVTGNFATETDKAVRAFQRTVGLDQDGVVGINTWRALID